MCQMDGWSMFWLILGGIVLAMALLNFLENLAKMVALTRMTKHLFEGIKGLSKEEAEKALKAVVDTLDGGSNKNYWKGDKPDEDD